MQLGRHPVAVVQYTFAHKQYMEQHNLHKKYKNNTIYYLGRVRAVSRLCELYPGISFTTEGKARNRPQFNKEQILQCAVTYATDMYS